MFYRYIRKSIGPVPWAGLLWKVAGASAAMLTAMFLVVQFSALLGLLVGLLVYPLALTALGTGSAGADFASAAARGLTAQGDWPKIKLAQEVSRV